MLFKSFMVFIHYVFKDEDQKVFVLFLYLCATTLVFGKVNKNQTYNYLSVYKLAVIQVTLNLWTSYMIAFCLVMENVLFDGGVYAWGIGVVFLVWLIVVKRE